MSSISRFTIFNSILIVVIFIFFIFGKPQRNNIVFIDNEKVFNSFRMVTDLRNSGFQDIELRKTRIDSMYTVLSKLTDSNQKEQILQTIIKERNSLENFDQKFTMTQTPKIWNRIKDYAESYSEENSYEFIFGSQNNVNLIYGPPGKDVTTDFITYINLKYSGKK